MKHYMDLSLRQKLWYSFKLYKSPCPTKRYYHLVIYRGVVSIITGLIEIFTLGRYSTYLVATASQEAIREGLRWKKEE
jgi:hypothetical protein